jgi:hypothetical protein
MPYTLKLSPKTARSIRAYVKNTDCADRAELAGLIRAELERFADMRTVDRRDWGPGVPLHRFFLRTSDGIGRYLQVTYRYDEDERAIWITSFAGIVPM